jgi:hypothetical protein
MAGEPERAGGSADAALPRRPPLCLARNSLTVRQFGPLESIDPNDAMILPHGANPDQMKFSERTGARRTASSDAQRQQHHRAYPHDKDDECYRVVIEPMSAVYPHDAPRLKNELAGTTFVPT